MFLPLAMYSIIISQDTVASSTDAAFGILSTTGYLVDKLANLCIWTIEEILLNNQL